MHTQHTRVEVRGKLVAAGSLLSQCGFWGSNSGPPACGEASLSTEASHGSQRSFFKALSTGPIFRSMAAFPRQSWPLQSLSEAPLLPMVKFLASPLEVIAPVFSYCLCVWPPTSLFPFSSVPLTNPMWETFCYNNWYDMLTFLSTACHLASVCLLATPLTLWDHFQRQKVEPGGSGTRL